ncbi:MAG: MBL fold metallo-hydrolase [Nitrospinota bacterium]|nr:MBL fold metallo-hydrolase [Nitrospinota bacterium]
MRIIAVCAFACITLSCATIRPSTAPSPRLLLHFIDVGEGDAILLQWIGRKPAWILVDTGNPVTSHLVLEYLRKAGAEELNAIIITHPHMDHAGGLFQIAQSMKVRAIYDNGEDPWSNGAPNNFYRWYAGFTRARPTYQALEAGANIPLGEAELEILWPPAGGFAHEHINARSLVILVRFGQFRALLAGDLVAPAETALARSGADVSAHILKAGHHGAQDAGSIEFLEKVAPQVVVVSVDRGNINGYPSSKFLERIEAVGAKTLRTDMDGDIVIEAQASGRLSIIQAPPDSESGEGERHSNVK